MMKGTISQFRIGIGGVTISWWGCGIVLSTAANGAKDGCPLFQRYDSCLRFEKGRVVSFWGKREAILKE